MNTNQTFHTPSFGDEEFEIPTYPVEQVYKISDLQNQSTHGSNDSSMMMGADYTVCEVSDDNGSQLTDGKKKKIRPNEPSKPVSAYALFFKDTQAAIKGQNPDASFIQVSKIVASMWEALDPEHKNVYKKKAETARREYSKALAAFRANAMISMGDDGNVHGVQDSASLINKNTALNTSNIIKSTGIQNCITAGQVAPGNVINQQIDENQRKVHIAEESTMQNQQHTRESEVDESLAVVQHRCIRDGCPNLAIINPDWEDEYCSNECVVTHCRNVFSKWVQASALSPEQFASS